MSKIIFLHHQRTGGSSFRHFFIHEIFSIPYRNEKRDYLISEINNYHQPVIELEPGIFIPELAHEHKMFSILRDPIERCLSWIELYTRPDQPNGFSIPSDKRTLEYRKTDDFWDHIHRLLTVRNNFNTNNTYIRSFIYNINKAIVNELDYENALKNSMNCDILIFDKHNMKHNIEFISNMYGIHGQKIEYPHFMIGNEDFVLSCPDYVKETISKNNYYDIKMYEYYKGTKDENNFIKQLEK